VQNHRFCAKQHTKTDFGTRVRGCRLAPGLKFGTKIGAREVLFQLILKKVPRACKLTRFFEFRKSAHFSSFSSFIYFIYNIDVFYDVQYSMICFANLPSFLLKRRISRAKLEQKRGFARPCSVLHARNPQNLILHQMRGPTFAKCKFCNFASCKITRASAIFAKLICKFLQIFANYFAKLQKSAKKALFCIPSQRNVKFRRNLSASHHGRE